MNLRIGSLFSGIGGLELGLEWSGLGHTVWQCEKDPFRRKVLEHHWPEVERHDDVETFSPEEGSADLLCGGFPCQDLSTAGKGAGLQGERSGLWREFHRIVQRVRPTWVVVENVHRGWRRWVPFVRRDLWADGYTSVPLRVRACETWAWHERARTFVVAADADAVQLRVQPGRGGWPDWKGALESAIARAAGPLTDADLERLSSQEYQAVPESCLARREARSRAGGRTWWEVEPCVDRVVHGVSRRVGSDPGVAALGDSVVPYVAEVVGHVIQQALDFQEQV